MCSLWAAVLGVGLTVLVLLFFVLFFFLIKKKHLGFCALCKLDLKIFLDVLSVPFEKS